MKNPYLLPSKWIRKYSTSHIDGMLVSLFEITLGVVGKQRKLKELIFFFEERLQKEERLLLVHVLSLLQKRLSHKQGKLHPLMESAETEPTRIDEDLRIFHFFQQGGKE